MQKEIKEIFVKDSNYYKRLDKFLRNAFPELKLGAIFSLIRKGDVKVNDKRVKKNDHEIFIGDKVSVTIIGENTESLTRPDRPEMKARYLKFNILYEDDDILAINKPPKTAVHPGSNEEMVTVIEGALYYAGDAFEPHLVHRLDKFTSGVFIIAKNKPAARELSDIIVNRDADKYYLTMVYGIPKKLSGELHSEVDGKDASLEYKVIETYKTQFGEFALIQVHLFTGRKHQIRVQFQQIGTPVLGDDMYGDHEINKIAKNAFGLRRYFLHSNRLTFRYKGKKHDIECDLNEDLKEALNKIESEAK